MAGAGTADCPPYLHIGLGGDAALCRRAPRRRGAGAAGARALPCDLGVKVEHKALVQLKALQQV